MRITSNKRLISLLKKQWTALVSFLHLKIDPLTTLIIFQINGAYGRKL
uniref:Uncharacterized protein n=1 Tax=Arundo donax TaxID=35708 RepID=A0A0A9CQK5_ARUDO